MNTSYPFVGKQPDINAGTGPNWTFGLQHSGPPIPGWWGVPAKSPPLNDLQEQVHSTPVLSWRLDRDNVPVAYGQMDISAFASRVAGLLKLERQHRERLAAVSLDPRAQKLLGALDKETSIRWEDLPDRAECDWSEASRSAVILAGANLCEASPTRIRLSEYGDRLLAESAPPDQPTPEIAN